MSAAADSKGAGASAGAAAPGKAAAAPVAVELIVWSIGGGEDPAGPQGGFADGDGAKSALFRTPKGLAVDSLRDALYIADSGNHRIRRFGADDRVTTAAGSGTAGFKDGKLMDCEFNNPTAVAVDPATGKLYIADTGNKRIRCVDFFSGSVWTIAGNGGPLRSASGAQPAGGSSAAKVNVDDGKGDGACFESPDSLAFDPNGNTLYVGDSGTGLVRLVDVKTRIVSTLKVGEDANIYRTAKAGGLTAIDFNASDKLLYLTDGDRVMYLRASDGSLLLQPGTGTGQKEGGAADPAALSGGPLRGLYAHSRQHKLYVCDADARAVRAVDELKGTVATVAGVVGERGHVDTAAERSKFDTPWGVTWDAGVLYVADAGNHCVRLIGTSQALQARKERGNAPCRVCADTDCVIA